MKHTHFYLAYCFFLLASCTDQIQTYEETPLGTATVQTLTLVSEPWRYQIENFGQLQVAETVSIGVESPGIINSVVLDDGMHVEASELLFALDDTKQQSRFEQATAAVREARTLQAQTAKDFKRFQRLRTDGAVSASQLQQAETNYKAAIARLTQAQAMLNIAKTELSERRILSPVNGVVEFKAVEKGQRVQPGEVLARIQTDGALQTLTYVNEHEVVQLRSGSEARVLVAGISFPALVESIGASSNPKTGNYSVKLRLQGEQSMLREGMSVQVNIPVTHNRDVIFIPRSAIAHRDRKRVVFISEGNIARQREVTFGLPTGDKVAVLSGLMAGEQLIVSPLELLIDGATISNSAESAQEPNPQKNNADTLHTSGINTSTIKASTVDAAAAVATDQPVENRAKPGIETARQ